MPPSNFRSRCFHAGGVGINLTADGLDASRITPDLPPEAGGIERGRQDARRSIRTARPGWSPRPSISPETVMRPQTISGPSAVAAACWNLSVQRVDDFDRDNAGVGSELSTALRSSASPLGAEPDQELALFKGEAESSRGAARLRWQRLERRTSWLCPPRRFDHRTLQRGRAQGADRSPPA